MKDLPYEPGTKVVITYIAQSQNPYVKIGEVYTVGDIFHVAPWLTSRGTTVPYDSQELLELGHSTLRIFHPIRFMRPIDKDTTEDDLEVIRQMSTKRKTYEMDFGKTNHE